MRRSIGVIVATALLIAITAPVATGAGSTWHRNNYNSGHERLQCSGATVWTCTYDNVREAGVEFNAKALGTFKGTAQEAAWCPDWSAVVCAHATSIVVGATIYGTNSGTPATHWQELIFTDGDGVAPMYQYFVGPQFEAVCPWYQTYAQALANDFECLFP
jgi:hypothetical protein